MNNIQIAEAWAKEYDSKLRADDLRFARSVTICHDEGTTLHYRFAFVLSKTINEEKFYAVFTEHHRWHVYPEGELNSIVQHGPQIKIEES